MTSALITVQGLAVDARGGRDVSTSILHDINLTIAPGEIVAAIGPSGSGKSTLGLALAGHFRPGLTATAGRITFDGVDLLTCAARELRKLRWRDIALVPQSAAASFNPALTIGAQVTERLRLDGLTNAHADARARDLFGDLELPEPQSIGARFPHQLSGGQLQRAAAAMAFAGRPKLVIFDEPTTSLDMTTQVGVLGTFRRLIRAHGVAAFYISHELNVVAQLADQIIALEHGRIVDRGRARQVLLSRVPRPNRQSTANGKRLAEPSRETLLAVDRVAFRHQRQGPLAVDSVSFDIRQGEIVGLIGESGSGKSTLARLVAGLLPPLSGSITLDGRLLAKAVGRRPAAARQHLQIVFQSADLALNPTHRVRSILGRPLQIFRNLTGVAQQTEIERLLDLLGLSPAVCDRLPSELSGGQKQRINLARALAAAPRLMICDEVTSGLDPALRGEIVDVLLGLRERTGLAFLFITHDLATAASLADKILVLHKGRLVEEGARTAVLSHPRHPYTLTLLESSPEPDPEWLDRALALRRTERPSVSEGCGFWPRCAITIAGVCDCRAPTAQGCGEEHRVACHAIGVDPGRVSRSDDRTDELARGRPSE